MSDLKIISFDGCPFAHRTRLLCAEKGVEREIVNIDLSDKPDWFLKLNPAGKVPVIQHGDHVIPESMAINEYVDEVFGGPKLLPEDPYKRALARVWILRLADATTGAWYRLATTLKDSPEFETKAAALVKALEDIDSALRQTSEAGPYFLGEEFSMVDVCLLPTITRLDVLDVVHGWKVPETESLARFHAYDKALRERPSAKAEGYDMDVMAAYIHKRLEQNSAK